MLNTTLINDLLQAYHEQESCILWLRSMIKNAPKGESIKKFENELLQAIKSKTVTRKMLDQYYIAGISSAKIYEDIYR